MTKTQPVPIEALEKDLRKRFPKETIELDRPKKRSGTWYLDVTANGHHVIIQWREGSGFGVTSSPEYVYGEGADEVYPDAEATYCRVVSLILSQTFTSPPKPVRLSELRKELGMSQMELAALLNKQQGEVSKLERRSDVLVSTLREVVESMGGSLKISAVFSNADERPLDIGVVVAPSRPKQSVISTR